MTTWDPRANDLFLEALNLESMGDLQAYLDDACGGDAILRAEVESLLEASSRARNFLESPVVIPNLVSDVEVPSASERPGTVIGPYKLLQQIGEGGMGVVFMAEQIQPVHRKVALKIIKPGMDSRQIIARFEAERQALAMMDHVNIARVVDAGATESGKPYFVMELVNGVPITKYCDDNLLTPRQRLELFVPVCQAIHHAHQKGIIHRDVKPSNVMVTLYDGKPVPKVIDFGVAKATEQKLTERTLFTQHGTTVGTLEYMSPEQAETSALGVDTRSDIYSLGVLLYELLTGSTPLTKMRIKDAAFGEILRIIKEEEHPKPSTRLSESGDALPSISAQRQTEPAKLSKLIKGELDWIVMKTLEKDRNRRYESASAFVADVQRYLANEPVQAGPPGAGYRVRKFVRRHRATVLAGAGAGVLLLGVVAALTVSLLMVNRERDKTQEALSAETHALDAESRARAAETRRRQQAREALDAMSSLVMGDWLARQNAQQLAPQQKAFLQKALSYYEEFAADTGREESVRSAVLSASSRVAYIQSKLGLHLDAVAAYRRAAELAAALAADFSDVPKYRHQGAVIYNNLGVLFVTMGRLKEAEQAYHTALLLLQQLATDFPSVSAYRNDLAIGQNYLGGLLSITGRYKEAENRFREALLIEKQLATDFPILPVYRSELAGIYSNLSVHFRTMGQSKEAQQACREAVAIQKQLAIDFPNAQEYREGLARSQTNLGFLLSEMRQTKDAEQAYREAELIQKQLASDFPSVPAYRQNLAMNLTNLGMLYSATARPKEAEQAYREALVIQKRLAADFPNVAEYRLGLARDQNNLGILLSAMGRRTEAEQTHRDGLNLRKQLASEFPNVPAYRQELAASLNNLGSLLILTNRLEDAEQTLREALAVKQQLITDFPTMPDYQNELAGTLWNLANIKLRMRQFDEARRLLEEAVPYHKAALQANPRHHEYRQTWRNNRMRLAQSLLGLLDHAAAVKMAEELLKASVNPAKDTYNAACFLSRCVPLAEKDSRLTESERRTQAQNYGDRAITVLRQAVATGYKDGQHMAKDDDLAPLRERPDFQQLLKEVTTRKVQK
jgi:eukaryotic-like serine/threonine-protein kinase